MLASPSWYTPFALSFWRVNGRHNTSTCPDVWGVEESLGFLIFSGLQDQLKFKIPQYGGLSSLHFLEIGLMIVIEIRL